MKSDAAQLYPVALNLRGKRCVVVGGGTVGARKAQALLEAGAQVVVVAPEVTEAIAELAAQGRLEHCPKKFEASDLTGAFLVIAATDAPSVNAFVADVARASGVLLNLAAPVATNETTGAESDSGDFVTMATVRRGELLLALTTGGAGPALSARLKRDLDAQFGPEWEPYVALLRDVRGEAYRRLATNTDAAAALRRIAARDDLREMIAAGDEQTARQEAMACLSY